MRKGVPEGKRLVFTHLWSASLVMENKTHYFAAKTAGVPLDDIAETKQQENGDDGLTE